MSHCAFIYTRHLTEEEVRSWLEFLQTIDVSITHLGKTDPPKRWTGDNGAVLPLILSGTDLTNRTFLRDSKARLHFGIELHRDLRWESDTISFSGVAAPLLIEIARRHSELFPCHAAIVGVSGGGKDQVWQIVHLSQDCPIALRAKITQAEQAAPSNGG